MIRYANHSCEPNCQLIELKVKREYRVYLRALCDIYAGEELTYDYNAQRLAAHYPNIACACGARECRGFINSD